MKLHIDPKHLEMTTHILQQYDYSFFAFGSRVTGRNKKFSDLDLFYIENIPNNLILQLEENFEESDIPFKVDVVDFYKCDKRFQTLMLEKCLCLQSSSRAKTIDQNRCNVVSVQDYQKA